MKPDDFEQRLHRQPWRPVPPEWRAEILKAAKAAQPAERSAGEVLAGWRLLFARFPVAWGAFAALWIALVSINVLLAGSDTPGAPQPTAASSFQSLMVWNRYSAELQQLASDDPNTDTETPARPAIIKPKSPRSERRRDWQLGEVFSEATLIA